MKNFFDRLKSEIKKSGWFFSILYLGIIAYVVLSISTGNIKAISFEAIIVISVIVILDFLNRLVKKKSEKLFKTIIILKKIRSFYDKNPWRKGFIYPGIFFISSVFIIFTLPGLEKENPFNYILNIYYILVFLGSPLWVIVGYLTASKAKPFAVSLITGFFILPAFIGYFAFRGFEGGAQTAATKSNHHSIIKYISAEIQKCKLGHSKFMNNNQDCPATALKAINGAVTIGWKNPFDTAKLSIRLSSSNTNDEDVGYVSLSASGSDIVIKTCIKTPCKNKVNQLKNSVSIK